MTKSISIASIESFSDKFQAKDYAIIQRSVTNNGIYASSENNFASAVNATIFSDEIETNAVTDQKNSGRCWLFAALNTLRHQIAKEYKLDDFELSETYSYFWDKLEKSNTFYEHIIESAGLPVDDRRVENLLDRPQGDGGWWEYAAAVITKYGIVPKYVMPEAVTTSKSNELNTLLNRKLRKDSFMLRQLVTSNDSKDNIQSTKMKMLSEIYRFLTIAIGTPPTTFNFSYKDKDKKFHRENGISPLLFLEKYTKNDLSNYVSILNDPSPTKSYEQTYIFEDGGNVIDGVEPLFLNLDMDNMKKLAMEQIKAGESIWFGCDIHSDVNKKGFMTTNIYDFEGTFGIDFSINKADRLLSHDSSGNHAMTITGVDVIDNEPVQWKVENSWGEEYGTKGYYTMSNDWFDKNGYVVVIRRDLLPEKLQKALAKKPKQISRWDPINSVYLL
jgi:bleomycin hydrolase